PAPGRDRAPARRRPADARGDVSPAAAARPGAGRNRDPVRLRATALAAIGLSLPLCGCIERALVVRSDPPAGQLGATGTDRGTTPLRRRYWRDGRYRLRLEKKGYETVADEVVTRTAFDALPGPDFFYENGPGRHVRETTRDYKLVPLTARP